MLEAEISLLVEIGASFSFPSEIEGWKCRWQLVFLREAKPILMRQHPIGGLLVKERGMRSNQAVRVFQI